MPEKRTYADRAEYIKQAVTKRRRKLKEMLVEYKGGKCVVCKYKKTSWALDLHHIDPIKKDFNMSVRGLTRSWERLKQEADKCVLLCANCHREIHAGITQLPKAISVEKRSEFGETQKGQSRAKPLKKRKV
ncbi:MAG: HNH endonuclease [Parcubacteria group bacterium LiPW_41]|nr:MAG: HNH endonuclease [Parcubacteria group bacterium LiPW_41]